MNRLCGLVSFSGCVSDKVHNQHKSKDREKRKKRYSIDRIVGNENKHGVFDSCKWV